MEEVVITQNIAETWSFQFMMADIRRVWKSRKGSGSRNPPWRRAMGAWHKERQAFFF